MKTTYSFVVYAWAKRSILMTCFGTYSSQALAFSRARELYYVGTNPVFIVAFPCKQVSVDYVPKVWTCEGTPRFETEVQISRCSILEFLDFVN